MRLQRDVHHVEQSSYPLAFIEIQGRCLLVHGTEWNRLDVSDPSTGELLTKRESPRYGNNEPRPAHYLDYFHSTILPSPGSTRIIDDGWVWGPAGVVRTWSIARWLDENVWESEDGPTLKDLWVDDSWGRPMCWIDDRRLVALTYDSCTDDVGGGLAFFDVERNERTQTVKVNSPWRCRIFYSDNLLFLCNCSTAVLDLESGTEVLVDPRVSLLRHHQGTKQFLGYRLGRPSTRLLCRLSAD